MTNPTPTPDVNALIERLSLHPSWRDSHGELNDAPNEAAQALRTLQARVGGWRPIETAPKDGSLLLFACANWPHSTVLGKPVPIKTGGWFSDERRWDVIGASWTPTHWMPLPASPLTSQEAQRHGE